MSRRRRRSFTYDQVTRQNPTTLPDYEAMGAAAYPDDWYPPENWFDLWAEDTLEIVEKVWRREGLRLYFRPGEEWLKDDLHSWLIEYTLQVRDDARFDPSPDPRDQWRGILYARLKTAARWHFTRVMGGQGLGSSDEMWNVVHSSTSIDYLTQREADTGIPAESGMRYLWPTLDGGDPARVVELIETLEGMLSSDEPAPAVDDGICSEPTCTLPTHGLGLCQRHYETHREHWGREDGSSQLCAVKGCPAFAVSRGMCRPHYRRVRYIEVRDGIAAPERELATGEGTICRAADCARPVKAKGLCSNHHQQWRTGGRVPLRDGEVLVRDDLPPCSIDGCESAATSKGWCTAHYRRYRKYGDPMGEPPSRACSSEGCERRYWGRGVCRWHWEQSKKEADS